MCDTTFQGPVKNGEECAAITHIRSKLLSNADRTELAVLAGSPIMCSTTISLCVVLECEASASAHICNP